jgi:hypothetical protein
MARKRHTDRREWGREDWLWDNLKGRLWLGLIAAGILGILKLAGVV